MLNNRFDIPIRSFIPSDDFKSPIFVDRESALDIAFTHFHWPEREFKMTDLLVVSDELVFTLIYSDAQFVLKISVNCELSGLLAWNLGVSWNDNTHQSNLFLNS